MKFSIVTLSFNQARFLEQAICSVLGQDYPDIEYIVVDPGSTDGSREIIRKYEPRISKVILEPDSGPAHGLNRGFESATGDVFGFINSDDALLPDALSRVAQAFGKDDGPDVVSGHLYLVDEKDRTIRRLRASQFSARRFVYGGVHIAQQSTFFRSDAFRAAGGFNQENRLSWDAELLLEMALQGRRFIVIDEYLALYRLYDGTITMSSDFANERLANRTRYFARVMGRRPHMLDNALRLAYRLDKWRRDPSGLGMRILDAFIPPSAPIGDLSCKKMLG